MLFRNYYIQNAKEIFGEDVDLDIWKDPTIEQLKLDDDEV